MKFTQEIKDKWIQALESGEFTQTNIKLHRTANNTYCCIGVLGVIHPDLTNHNDYDEKSPYHFLNATLGAITKRTIFNQNDNTFNPDKPDYSNVLPLIKSLPVQNEI